jgi:hypothetical protein
LLRHLLGRYVDNAPGSDRNRTLAQALCEEVPFTSSGRHYGCPTQRAVRNPFFCRSQPWRFLQTCAFVIVGGKERAHLKNLQKPWGRIRKAAGLDGVRIHDLRHSACWIANIALNDAMILPYGANLGRMEFSERTGCSTASIRACSQTEHRSNLRECVLASAFPPPLSCVTLAPVNTLAGSASQSFTSYLPW